MARYELTAAEASALEAQEDSATGLDFPEASQNYVTEGIRWLHRLCRMADVSDAFRVDKDATGDLTYMVNAGELEFNGSVVTYAGATNQSLTDDATNYIYLDLTSGSAVLTKDTSWPAAGTPHVRLATIATGTASAAGISGTYAYSDITDCRDSAAWRPLQLGNKTVGIPATLCVKRDAMKDALPDAADGTYLGLADAAGSVLVGSTTNNSQVNEKCAFYLVLPKEYIAQQNITIRLNAKVSAARNAESLLDVVAKRVTNAGLDATDLCLTSAVDMKAVTSFTDEDFTIDGDASGDELAAGDILYIEVAFETDDTGGGSDGYGEIGLIQALIPCR